MTSHKTIKQMRGLGGRRPTQKMLDEAKMTGGEWDREAKRQRETAEDWVGSREQKGLFAWGRRK